jgi:hypothetical protein
MKETNLSEQFYERYQQLQDGLVTLHLDDNQVITGYIAGVRRGENGFIYQWHIIDHPSELLAPVDPFGCFFGKYVLHKKVISIYLNQQDLVYTFKPPSL